MNTERAASRLLHSYLPIAHGVVTSTKSYAIASAEFLGGCKMLDALGLVMTPAEAELVVIETVREQPPRPTYSPMNNGPQKDWDAATSARIHAKLFPADTKESV